MAHGSILVVEGGPDAPWTSLVRAMGHEAFSAARPLEAERILAVERPHLVLLDRDLPEGSALDLLRRLRDLDASTPVVLLLEPGCIEEAAEGARLGADKFLVKPVDPDVLRVLLGRLADQERGRRAGNDGGEPVPISPFFGSSPLMARLEQQVRRLLPLDRPILIQGETGTGKSLLARWIHGHSPRKARPVMELNCAGLSRELLESDLFGHEKGSFTGATAAKPGLLEVADRGTVFLDEIGDMDLSVQPKILKAVEERRFRRVGGTEDRNLDVRLIGASHKDLAQLVAEGKFRADLFYRIGGLPVLIPPLRERPEDIGPFARYFLARAAREFACPGLDLSPAAVRLLQIRAWPGNLRELKNAVERAIVYRGSPILEPADFALAAEPGPAPRDARLGMSLAEVEEEHIQAVLESCGGRVEEAARRLGISRSSLYQRLRRQSGGPASD